MKYVGDLKQSCKKILLLPGAAGGTSQIKAIGKFDPEVVLVGELSEWETAEYVRGAHAGGNRLSLVALGQGLIGGTSWHSTIDYYVPGKIQVI